MSQTLKAVRGTRDLLPPETALWNRIEATARSVFARYNFGEIRTRVKNGLQHPALNRGIQKHSRLWSVRGGFI